MEVPSPANVGATFARSAQSKQRDEEFERPDTIRSFAWFPYKGDEWIEDRQELARRAWPATLQALADLAEDEDWSGAHAGDRPLPILDMFIRYTYQRLVMEQKILVSEDGTFAAFNTGLLTAHAEDIFGLFQRNDRVDAQPWIFKRWATESDRDMLRYFETAPEMAAFVTTASDLVFDLERDLKPNYSHILVDRLERFPPELSTQPTRARQALDHAIALTRKRARRNYKIVVPQWYPRTQEAGFLLPLDLLGRGTADLALVVSEASGTMYRGDTVLTLEMAYTVARLVSRPDSDWLKPHAMPHDEEDQEL